MSSNPCQLSMQLKLCADYGTELTGLEPGVRTEPRFHDMEVKINNFHVAICCADHDSHNKVA